MGHTRRTHCVKTFQKTDNIEFRVQTSNAVENELVTDNKI